MVRVVENHRIATLVRMYGLEPYMIARVLDTGADGIKLSPSSRQEAEDLVKMCKLRPIGVRGACPASRQAKYRLIPDEEYTRLTNQAVVVVGIETKEGLEHVLARMTFPTL